MLYEAAARGDLSAVKKAIDEGASPSCLTLSLSGMNALHVALNNNHTKVALFLINKMSLEDLNVAFEGGVAPIHLAAKTGQLDVARALIARGVSVNAVDANNKTPLFYALNSSHAHKQYLVEYLLAMGTNTAICDSNGLAAIHYAVSGSPICLRLLLLFSPGDVHLPTTVKGYLPMHFACSSGLVESARILRAYNASFADTDKSGQPALCHAVKGRHNVFLQYAVMTAPDESKRALALTNASGHSAVHFAAGMGNIFVINLIQKLLGDIAVQNASELTGRNCVHGAAFMGQARAIAELSRLGVNVDLRSKDFTIRGATYYGRTPLQIACIRGQVDAAMELIRAGADTSVVTESGETLYHLAAKTEMYHTIIHLSRSDIPVDINAKNSEGKTFADIVHQNRNCICCSSDEICACMISIGAMRSVPTSEENKAADSIVSSFFMFDEYYKTKLPAKTPSPKGSPESSDTECGGPAPKRHKPS